MAGFLRKKSKQDTSPVKQQRSPPLPSSDAMTTTASPPLFARFATTTSNHNGPPPPRKVVSGPMMLAPANRRESVNRASPRGAGELRNQLYNVERNASRDNARGSPRRAPDSQNSSYVSNLSDRLSMAARVDKPLPAPAGQVDQLSSAPPPSMLPPNRRISMRSDVSTPPTTFSPFSQPKQLPNVLHKHQAEEGPRLQPAFRSVDDRPNSLAVSDRADASSRAARGRPLPRPGQQNRNVPPGNDQQAFGNGQNAGPFQSEVDRRSMASEAAPQGVRTSIYAPLSGPRKPSVKEPPNSFSSPEPTSQPRKMPSTRSVNGPARRGPLIFAAMNAEEPEFEPLDANPPPEPPRAAFLPSQAYPSPPSEHMSPKARQPPLPAAMDGPPPAPKPFNTPRKRPPQVTDNSRIRAAPAPPPPNESLPSIPAALASTTRTMSPTPPPVPKAGPSTTPSRAFKQSNVGKSGAAVNGRHLPDIPKPGSSDGHQPGSHRLQKARPTSPQSPPRQPPAPSANIGISLADDPFAKPEGVRMLGPQSHEADLPAPQTASVAEVLDWEQEQLTHQQRQPEPEPVVQRARSPPPRPPVAPPSPVSPKQTNPDEYRQARAQRRAAGQAKPVPADVAALTVRKDRPAEPFPLDLFLSDAHLLGTLVGFLSFYDWCLLSSVAKKIRLKFIQDLSLKEEVLERFLKTVGYKRWTWKEAEPLVISLQDLHEYMRGVSLPTHEYATVAHAFLGQMQIHPNHRDPVVLGQAASLKAATCAYSRLVLRLRAQGEKEAANPSSRATSRARPPNVGPPVSSSGRAASSSRPPSPMSIFSQSHAGQANGRGSSASPRPTTPANGGVFQSPLFRLKRAPLLRVFVPSPEGDWLSDQGVLECEAELRRAGVSHLLRVGDVTWDVAVGDEGNVGRLVWDGSYLIDLDYTYSAVGDLPKYLPTLAFPPSYFHRVIRSGASSGNPAVRIDISPWGEQIASNLQLLQDRVKTETPQGAYHNVVRWVHRSSFTIRPPAVAGPGYRSRSRPGSPRIPIPDAPGMFIDPGWYGTVVVETEGTNECLADLQDRCGPGAFPPRAPGMVAAAMRNADKDSKLVFRILRERSRPGEIWIRAVSPKERQM